MSVPDNYLDPYEWAVECEARAEKAEARVKELESKRREEALEGQASLDEANNRIKELESEVGQWFERAHKMQNIINDYGIPCDMLPFKIKEGES